jgi:hypothetical protein
MAMKRSTERREFLKMTAAGAAGIALTSGVRNVFSRSLSGGADKSPLNKWPGRVVVNFNKAAVKGSGATAQPDVIKTMVDDSIKRLTDQTELGAAWRAIFPDALTATSKIAIKVNTLNSGLPAPHWSSVKAMTDGLQLMDLSGTKFPAANITIYDMNNGSTTENRLSQAGYKTDNFPGGINIITDIAEDGGDGALNNRKYAKTLKTADYLINVFGARGHDIPPAGSQFSMGFKSHYGTYFDANGMHGDVPGNLRAINALGPVYNKQVLNVCIGIYGTNENRGPTQTAENFTTYALKIDSSSTTQCPTTIILSTDPISAEMQAIKILRMNKTGGAFGVSDMPPYLKSCAGIETTGLSPTHDLGEIDEAKMDIRRILNGEIVAAKNPPLLSGSRPIAGIWAHQVKGHSTFIDFTLSKEHFGRQAIIEITDARGGVMREFSQKVLGVNNQFSWDERDRRGNMAAQGIYFVRLSCGPDRHTTQFSIVR